MSFNSRSSGASWRLCGSASPSIARRGFLVGGFALLCAGCVTRPQPVVYGPPPPMPPPLPDPKTQMGALETRIFQLVQQQRQAVDPSAQTLKIDPLLVDVARKRSADMAAKGYFADAAPDGTTSASLVMDEDAQFQGLLGVNMAAQHYRVQLGIKVDDFAHRFLDTWINSQSHKQNLVFPEYNRTGIGAALNGDTVYVTELFATDLGLPPPKLSAPRGKITPMDSPQAAKRAMASPPPTLRTQAEATP
jgi:uncharacterized protein YkwD